MGCGSGILSIIGLMLGAGEAMATDVDPNAVSAAIENARVNHINMNQYDVKAGDIITEWISDMPVVMRNMILCWRIFLQMLLFRFQV